MKATGTQFWSFPGNGNNSSGFTGLPEGIRNMECKGGKRIKGI
jgi:hypothetical protein